MSFTTEPTRTKRPCGISSFIPLGMSCRDRAEAFARSLQSRLRTLGTQVYTDDKLCDRLVPDINLGVFFFKAPTPAELPAPIVQEPLTENSWLIQSAPSNSDNTNPLLNRLPDTDSFFDFDIETDSPASPAEECDYLRIVDKQSKPIPADIVSESGVCSSPSLSSRSSGESHVSSDGPFFDPDGSEADQRSVSLSIDYYDCVDGKSKDPPEYQNGFAYPVIDSDSCSESLPQSQSTTTSLSTFTGFSSASNNTLQDEAMLDAVMPKEQPDTSETASTDDRSEMNSTHGLRIDMSKLEHMKPMTLDFPRLIESTPEASPEPVERNEEPEKNETTAEHLAVSHEEDDAKPQRVRRCSSLKTGKTPPGKLHFVEILSIVD